MSVSLNSTTYHQWSSKDDWEESCALHGLFVIYESSNDAKGKMGIRDGDDDMLMSDGAGSDVDNMEERVLFFSPNSIPLNDRLFFVGTVEAWKEFVKTWASDEKIELFEHRNLKIAIEEMEGKTFLFGNKLECSDELIKSQLRWILDAFRFYCGPLSSISAVNIHNSIQFFEFVDMFIQRCENEKECAEEIVRCCSHVSVMWRELQNPSIGALFPHVVQHSGDDSSRLFGLSEELIEDVENISGNIAAMVCIGDGKILCSHMIPEIETFISHRLRSLSFLSNVEEYDTPSGTPVPFKPPSPHTNRFVTFSMISSKDSSEFLPVFVSKKQLELLRGNTRFVGDSTRSSSGVASPTKDKRGMNGVTCSEMLSQMYPCSDDGLFVGLHIHHCLHLSVAVLMELGGLYDQRHISHTRMVIQQRLPEIIGLVPENEDLNASNSSTTLGGQDIKLTSPEGTVVVPRFMRASYEGMTRSLSWSSSHTKGTQYPFFSKTSFCRNTLLRDGSSLVITKDVSSVSFGRRVFDSEVYFEVLKQRGGRRSAHIPGYDQIQSMAEDIFAKEGRQLTL